MQELSPVNKRAADYNSNRAIIEADVRRDVEKIQKTIASGGLQDYFDGKITESSKFQSLVSATQKQSLEFKLAKDRIAKELSKIGYELPTMDKNFSVDFNDFLSGSSSFFKKQYINDCVTGADKSGTAISTEQILSSLKQISTGSTGTARDKYKAALQSILNSDAFIEDKMNQIKALEGTYKDISITYQNANSQKVTSTPYDLYMKTIAACESRFKQDETFSSSSSGVSQKKKIERGQALLRDLKDLHDNYSSQLGSRVLEQVLTCNGEAKKSGSACGDKNSFDSTSASFCMSHASQCANEVNGCYSEANKHVETRKTKLEAQAKTFNNNAAALVDRSNALYNAQKNAVMDMAKIVQARFPGTNFEIPAGMFISMPEMKKDAYGVEMLNDGNLAFMDELPKKIDLLKKVFKDQQATANNEIKSYIDKQAQAMAREKERWNMLASDCKGNIDTSSREVAKMNNENSKRQGELDNNVKNFCRKYQSLAIHPVGGCDNAKKLSEEMDNVASRLTSSVTTNIVEFNNVCNSYSNESTNSSSNLFEECSADNMLKGGALFKAACNERFNQAGKKPEDAPGGKRISLTSLCGSGKDDAAFVNSVLLSLPEIEQKKFSKGEQKDSIVSALKKGHKELDNIKDLNQLNGFEIFYDLSKIAGASSEDNSLCSKLVEIEGRAEKDADNAATATPATTTKTPDQIKNDKIIKALADFSTKASLKMNIANSKEADFSKIGEQIDNNTLCDAQNSTANLIKEEPTMEELSLDFVL